MKPTSGGFSERAKDKFLRAGQTVNYQNIAGGLAGEMIGSMRPSEPRKCSPPFKMVIIDRRGTVVFECKVSRGGRVRPLGLACRVEDTHFPAMALLTDSSFLTRTFRIEQARRGSPGC
jgi:hypothetical protein